MSPDAPAVALLFDDADLGEQLRVALNERGARIVHQGDMSTLTRELLEKVGAQVLVVNLDDAADDALDRLYQVIDGDKPRVVFNDAEASRALTGWDRARWARHLAVKVLEMGDIDPPRPENVPVIGTAASEMPMPADESDANARSDEPTGHVAHASAEGMEAGGGTPGETLEDASPALASPSPMSDTPSQAHEGEVHGRVTSAESESLAAELDALLASGELSIEEAEPIGSGLRFTGEEDLPPLHDGYFGARAVEELDPDALRPAKIRGAGAEEEARPSSVTPPVFQLDHLELAPMNDVLPLTIPAASAGPMPVDALAAKVPAPGSWTLLDDDASFIAAPAAAPASARKAAAADFGIHKVSATEFLAPEADRTESDDELVMSLQLVSMEEAIAPQAYDAAENLHTNSLHTNSLERIVLLGAAAGGTGAVCRFLAALPVKTHLAFVHTQHLGQTPVDTLVETLSAHSTLPVRVAKQGISARKGEILVVPAGQQLLLIRDGSVELMPSGMPASQEPSIDASFSMAANVFGRDALAIVFSGRGTDAVAGAQAIHDRGGKVWIESPTSEHYADMVNGISAERLVSFSGTPHELAAHLIEVFP